MSKKLIENLSDIPINITLNELQLLNHSGRSYNITGSQDYKKKFKYRSGIITPYGDIELSVWQEAIKRIADRTDSSKMLNNLKEWVSENLSWCKNKEDIETEALELYSMSIWENTEWADYNAFRERYLKEGLD